MGGVGDLVNLLQDLRRGLGRPPPHLQRRRALRRPRGAQDVQGRRAAGEGAIYTYDVRIDGGGGGPKIDDSTGRLRDLDNDKGRGGLKSLTYCGRHMHMPPEDVRRRQVRLGRGVQDEGRGRHGAVRAQANSLRDEGGGADAERGTCRYSGQAVWGEIKVVIVNEQVVVCMFIGRST